MHHSNKVIIAHGAELKAFDNGNEDWSSFSNYPTEPTSLVFLSIVHDDLKFLVKSLDLKKIEPTSAAFLESFTNAYDGHLVEVIYALAFQGVRALLNLAIK